MSHDTLVRDFRSIVRNGLDAKVQHSYGQTARQVCQHLLQIALDNASEEEKEYIPTVRKRIEQGNLSDIIRARVKRKAQRIGFREAIISVYSELMKSLMDNQPYF
jgi:hypothetical protein